MQALTDEQRQIAELARRFADERVAPQAAGWDAEHEFPHRTLTEMGELGLLLSGTPGIQLLGGAAKLGQNS